MSKLTEAYNKYITIRTAELIKIRDKIKNNDIFDMKGFCATWDPNSDYGDTIKYKEFSLPYQVPKDAKLWGEDEKILINKINFIDAAKLEELNIKSFEYEKCYINTYGFGHKKIGKQNEKIDMTMIHEKGFKINI